MTCLSRVHCQCVAGSGWEQSPSEISHSFCGPAGKVIKDYPRDRVVVVMKWGPWGKPPPSHIAMVFIFASCRADQTVCLWRSFQCFQHLQCPVYTLVLWCCSTSIQCVTRHDGDFVCSDPGEGLLCRPLSVTVQVSPHISPCLLLSFLDLLDSLM